MPKLKPVEITLAPMPEGGALTRENVAGYMESWAELLHAVSFVAGYATDKAAREGAVSMLGDLGRLAAAAVRVATTGAPERVVRADFRPDAEDELAELAAMLEAMCVQPGVFGDCLEPAHGVLARELRARLGAETAGRALQ
jgi:hypothetical protein